MSTPPPPSPPPSSSPQPRSLASTPAFCRPYSRTPAGPLCGASSATTEQPVARLTLVLAAERCSARAHVMIGSRGINDSNLKQRAGTLRSPFPIGNEPRIIRPGNCCERARLSKATQRRETTRSLSATFFSLSF